MNAAHSPIDAAPSNPLPWVVGLGIAIGAIVVLSRSRSQSSGSNYSLQQRPIQLISNQPDSAQRAIVAIAQAQLYSLRYLPATSNITGDLDSVTQDALRRFAQSYSNAIAIEQSHAPADEQVVLTVLDNLYRFTYGLSAAT